MGRDQAACDECEREDEMKVGETKWGEGIVCKCPSTAGLPAWYDWCDHLQPRTLTRFHSVVQVVATGWNPVQR